MFLLQMGRDAVFHVMMMKNSHQMANTAFINVKKAGSGLQMVMDV